MSAKSREDINNDLDSTIISGGTPITGNVLNAELKKITESYHNKLSDPTPVDETSEQTISGQKTFGSSIKATGGIEGNGTTLAIDTNNSATINIGGINSVVNIPGSLVNSALGGAVESITHADLKLKLDNSELVAGKIYLINDFQTKHQIPDTTDIHTETIEPILVTALTTNKLGAQALSTVYENDILHYDITNNLCEDGTTPRRGVITRRIDTKNVLETPYDFRGVKYWRGKINGFRFYSSNKVSTSSYEVTIDNDFGNNSEYFEAHIQFSDVSHDANPTLTVSSSYFSAPITKELKDIKGNELSANQLASIVDVNNRVLVYYSPDQDALLLIPINFNGYYVESECIGYFAWNQTQDLGPKSQWTGIEGSAIPLDYDSSDYQLVYTFDNQKEPTNFKNVRVDYKSSYRLSNVFFTNVPISIYNIDIAYCSNMTTSGYFHENRITLVDYFLSLAYTDFSRAENIQRSIFSRVQGLRSGTRIGWALLMFNGQAIHIKIEDLVFGVVRVIRAERDITGFSNQSRLNIRSSWSFLNFESLFHADISMPKATNVKSDFLIAEYKKYSLDISDGNYITQSIFDNTELCKLKDLKFQESQGFPPVSLAIGESWLDTITNQVKVKTGNEVAYYLDQDLSHDFTTTVDGSNRIATKTYSSLSLTLNYTYNGVLIYPETIDDGTYKVDFTYDANGNVLTKTYGLI